MKLDRFLPGVAVGAIAGSALAANAAVKTYHYTGVVRQVSPTEIVVDKGGEAWDFVVDGATAGAEVKGGDKVTVTYRMLATRVDKK
jgi:hypothetical protein